MVPLPATRLYWSTSTVQRRGPEAFGFSTFSLQEPSEYRSVSRSPAMAWALCRKRGAGGLSAGAVGGECDHLNAPAESWVDRGERHSWGAAQ